MNISACDAVCGFALFSTEKYTATNVDNRSDVCPCLMYESVLLGILPGSGVVSPYVSCHILRKDRQATPVMACTSGMRMPSRTSLVALIWFLMKRSSVFITPAAAKREGLSCTRVWR